MPADPAIPANSPAARTGATGRRVTDRQAPRTADDDLLVATLLRMWEYVSGRSLPPNVRLDQLSKEELIGFWADDAEPAATPANGQVSVMLAVDILGFTRRDRDEEVRIYLHKVLYEILLEALQASGVPWDRCHHEDRGDGALVVLPSGIPAHGIINPFPERLRGLIRLHNRMSCPEARVQVRVAAHIGPVYRDDHGLIGDDINLLFRMLNARPLRTALAGSGAELALALSGYLYDSFVRRHPALTGPALFRPMNTTVKGTRVNAWIHIPGVPPQLAQQTRRPAQGPGTVTFLVLSRRLATWIDGRVVVAGGALLTMIGVPPFALAGAHGDELVLLAAQFIQGIGLGAFTGTFWWIFGLSALPLVLAFFLPNGPDASARPLEPVSMDPDRLAASTQASYSLPGIPVALTVTSRVPGWTVRVKPLLLLMVVPPWPRGTAAPE